MIKFKLDTPLQKEVRNLAIENGGVISSNMITFLAADGFIAFAAHKTMESLGFSVECEQYLAHWEGDWDNSEKEYSLEEYRWVVRYNRLVWRFQSERDEDPELVDFATYQEDMERELECWMAFYE